MSTEITVVNDIVEINVQEDVIVIEAPSGAYPLPTGVYSVYGRTGNVVAQDGDYNLTQLGDVTITSPATGQVLRYNGTTWVNSTESYVGTVTSVAMTTPTGLTVTGSPITTSGTLALALASGYVIPTQAQLDAKQDDLNGTGIVKSTAGVISYLTDNTANWDTAYSRSLTSAAVTGTTTKTLTLNEQGGGTITATWSDYDTAPVTSVFGRTGAVVAVSGDYTTLLVPENTNLYFTNQRARFAISGDSNSGVVYSNTTGIIALDDIPNTSLLHDSITINGYLTALGGTVTLTTTDVAEGTNLYYTQARFNSAFDAKTTTDLTEGTNLYFTNARAQAAITGTAPISVVSGNVSISQAGASTNGYLSSTNWNTFNNKQNAITLTVTGNSGSATLVGATLNIPTYTLAGLGGISLTGLSASSPLLYDNTTGNFSIQVANVSQNGYLSSTDWSTFNSKQAALNGTGFVKISGTTISYDNSTYLTTISGIAAGGELSGTYANPSLVNSAVTGKLLTGVNITGGTIQDTDSILTGFGKLQNQINGLIGGSIYKGTWNASTNNPTLTSSVGTAGWYYIVNVAGSTNLNGITDWNVGDWAIFNGGVWQKVDNTDAVVSVNGFTGAVSLTTSNISEGTNLYYTDARARGVLSAGTGISYNSTTGVITNSAPDQTVSLTGGTGISTSGAYPNFTITNTAPDQTVSLTGAGTTSISGTYPNFTITSNDQYTGTVTSVGITESSAALTITGSPVTTSGNINIGFAGTSAQYVAGDGSLVTFPTVVTQAQNLVTEVYNSTGATLTKGTIVYINGGQGNLPTVTKALATSDATSAQTYGIVRTDITNMNNGYVTVIGNLENIDTQAYAAGTQLYLSGTTAGAWTDVKPYAPIHLVYVGIVVRSHPTQGVIEVKIQNGFELDELHNVSAQSPNNGDILQYNSSTSLWTSVAGTTSNITEGSRLYYTDARARGAVSLTTTGNNGASTYNSTTGVLNVPTYTLAGLGGINLSSLSATTPLLYNNTTGVFSIQQANGTQAGYLSSADWTTFNSKQGTITLTTTGTSGAATFSAGTLNIPQYQAALTNPVTGTGTSGYHAKFTGTSTLGNSLIWDNGTNVGIGTASPVQKLNVNGNIRIDGSGLTEFIINNGTNEWEMYMPSGSNDLRFYRGTDKMTLASGGNVGIGRTNPEFTLDVNGDIALSRTNKLMFSGPTAGDRSRSYLAGDGNNNIFVYGPSSNLIATFGYTGNVGIGTSIPNSLLNITGNNATVYDATSDSGQEDAGVTAVIRNNDTSTAGSFSQIDMMVSGDSGRAVGRIVTIRTASATSDMAFVTENANTKAEKVRITGAGFLKVSNTGAYFTATTTPTHEIKSDANDDTLRIFNSNTSYNAAIIQARGSRNTTNSSWYFLQCYNDGSGLNKLLIADSGNVTNTNGSYGAFSDIKLKENIVDATPKLEDLLKVKIRNYNLIGDTQKQIGVVAQELEEIFPSLIEESIDKDEEANDLGTTTKSVKYSVFVPILIKAIQELSAKVTALENK
jgi:hypothetical protein